MEKRKENRCLARGMPHFVCALVWDYDSHRDRAAGIRSALAGGGLGGLLQWRPPAPPSHHRTPGETRARRQQRRPGSLPERCRVCCVQPVRACSAVLSGGCAPFLSLPSAASRCLPTTRTIHTSVTVPPPPPNFRHQHFDK